MKEHVLKALEDLGIGYQYLINGFIGGVVWSLYKKTKLVDAVRQVLIGSLVAGYLTPLIAHTQNISVEFLAALSFVVGMIGMVIIDGIYRIVANKIKAVTSGDKIAPKEEVQP